MKTILFVLLVFLGTSLNAQIPTAFTLRAGDSPIKGLAGIELQMSNYSLSAGWRPIQDPIDKNYNSFSGAFTVYSDQWYKSCWYASLGAASKGYLYQPTIHIPNLPGDYIPEPSAVLMVGRRINTRNLNHSWSNKCIVDVGGGYSVSEHSNYFTFEMIFNFVLLNNHKKMSGARYY